MTYELAKKLKDAGFPQGGDGDYVYLHQIPSRDGYEKEYAPTLSELIEACGLGFQSLELSSGIHSDRRPPHLRWIAHAYQNGYLKDANGSTPEEAVAELWLSLQKPPTP